MPTFEHRGRTRAGAGCTVILDSSAIVASPRIEPEAEIFASPIGQVRAVGLAATSFLESALILGPSHDSFSHAHAHAHALAMDKRELSSFKTVRPDDSGRDFSPTDVLVAS